MRLPHRPLAGGRSTLLMAILLLTLALAATLAYHALDAARNQRATAERALRDYASIIAWDYSLYVRDKIYGVMTEAFKSINQADLRDPAAPLPPPDVIAATTAQAARCETAAEDAARYYFRVDLRDGSVVTSGAPTSPAVERWVSHSVSSYVRSVYRTDWIYAHLYGVADGRHRAIAFTVKRDGESRPILAYGFESCMASWGESIFDLVMREEDLVPPALRAGLPNDSLFSVRVTDELGRELYRSPIQYPRTISSSFTAGGGYGGVVTQVSLSPAAESRLVAGGIPRSRMPFLLGLLTLTTALVGVAILQLRREQELSRLRSGFVSSVSHELRTPLAQIRMFAETLLLGRVRSEEERHRSLEIIDQEARRLTHLVENVLQFSRAERRTTRLTPERVELAPEVREAVEGFAPLAQSQRTRLVTELEDGIFAHIDRYAFRQVLLNLLDNAVKYGPAGQTVTVALEQRGGRACISVSDEGPGVGSQDRQRIWEPFYRREQDARSAVAGSGIGLSVVRELVALQGGRAWVEAGERGGARFVVELPRTRPHLTPTDGAPDPTPESEATHV